MRISFFDSPNGKKPGQDGLPAAFLKRYCHQLAIIFQEAWIELASGRASIDHVGMCLGCKKWIVVPKVEGANTIEKLRDLELGNEVRKVLARMLFLEFRMRFVNMNRMDSAMHSKLS